MEQVVKCTKCGANAKGYGSVSCLCDKDNCHGQRCAANNLSRNFECSCGETGTPEATLVYMKKHCS